MEMPIDIQHQQMGYDRTATMFSPEGHLLQVEYAEKTVRLGSSSIGIVCSDGIVILSDKRIKDTLIVKSSANKIHEIDSHIIASVAGIVSDARVLIEREQVVAQQHQVTYDEPIEPELVIKDIANTKQKFTQYGGAFMIAGLNGIHPQLFVSDITGNYLSYYANAIGENDEKIKEILREKYKKDLTIPKATKLALEIFKEIQEENFEIDNFEIAYLDKKNKKIVRAEGKNIEKI